MNEMFYAAGDALGNWDCTVIQTVSGRFKTPDEGLRGQDSMFVTAQNAVDRYVERAADSHECQGFVRCVSTGVDLVAEVVWDGTARSQYFCEYSEWSHKNPLDIVSVRADARRRGLIVDFQLRDQNNKYLHPSTLDTLSPATLAGAHGIDATISRYGNDGHHLTERYHSHAVPLKEHMALTLARAAMDQFEAKYPTAAQKMERRANASDGK